LASYCEQSKLNHILAKAQWEGLMASQKRQAPATLATRAGSYREQPPKRGLARHFHCLWSHSVTSSGRIAIVPDGYCDLVWIGGRVMVAGPDRTSAFPDMATGEEVVGARFAPGSAAEWLGLPLSEIVGQSVPLEDFWGTKARTLGQQLSDCRDNRERLQLLQAVLEKKAGEHSPPPDDIRHAFGIATAHSTDDLTDRLLADISIGERQLRRRCHHYFGYGAKTLCASEGSSDCSLCCGRHHRHPSPRLPLPSATATRRT
jgi:hypothetical protein